MWQISFLNNFLYKVIPYINEQNVLIRIIKIIIVKFVKFSFYFELYKPWKQLRKIILGCLITFLLKITIIFGTLKNLLVNSPKEVNLLVDDQQTIFSCSVAKRYCLIAIHNNNHDELNSHDYYAIQFERDKRESIIIIMTSALIEMHFNSSNCMAVRNDRINT